MSVEGAVKRGRIESVDVVRGVIMVLMVLDHTRDFLGKPGFNPTNPATTTIPLFFTRWAPISAHRFSFCCSALARIFRCAGNPDASCRASSSLAVCG